MFHITQILGIFHLQQILEGDVQDPQNGTSIPSPVQFISNLRSQVGNLIRLDHDSSSRLLRSAMKHLRQQQMLGHRGFQDTGTRAAAEDG